jgi:putative DNA primase/helicase
MQPTNGLREQALATARSGIPVFPLHSALAGECSCGIKKCGRKGKHPRTPRGFKDATTDVLTIERWWTAHPDAGLWMPTGSPSGVLVIDVDPRNGGDITLASLQNTFGAFPPTRTVKTGGGGQHIYFQLPDGPFFKDLGAGVDVKADGGYVVLPPTTHESGASYEVIDASEPALAPPWLVAAITRIAKPTPQGISPLNRNVTLTSLAGSMRRAGMSPDAMRAALVEENQRRFEPPLPNYEIEQIVRSIGNKPDVGSTFALTDAGNAEFFAAMFGGELRFDHQRGRWLIWSGNSWRPDADGHVTRLALQAARARAHDAVDAGDAGKEALKWAKASESSGKLAATVNLARSQRPIADNGRGWDSDPMLLATENGVVELGTGRLRAGTASRSSPR